MGNKAHLRPHKKQRQASRTTGLILMVVFIALVALATAVAASGHAILPAGRIIPLPVAQKDNVETRAGTADDDGVVAFTEVFGPIATRSAAGLESRPRHRNATKVKQAHPVTARAPRGIRPPRPPAAQLAALRA